MMAEELARYDNALVEIESLEGQVERADSIISFGQLRISNLSDQVDNLERQNEIQSQEIDNVIQQRDNFEQMFKGQRKSKRILIGGIILSFIAGFIAGG